MTDGIIIIVHNTARNKKVSTFFRNICIAKIQTSMSTVTNIFIQNLLKGQRSKSSVSQQEV